MTFSQSAKNSELSCVIFLVVDWQRNIGTFEQSRVLIFLLKMHLWQQPGSNAENFPRNIAENHWVFFRVFEVYCGYMLPLHRQEKDFKSKGIPLLKATMSNWVCYAAEKWCAPIVQNMKEKLLSEKIIHADETVFQVLHEKGRKATTDSRMWVYCNGKINDRSNIIFDYHPK